MGFQLYSSNTDEGLEGGKAHGWVVQICLRNGWPLKLETSVVEMCEKIFLLLEVKIKFSVEQKVFIICVCYATKSHKKVLGEFSAKYGEFRLILTIIVCSQVKIHLNIAS